MNVLYVNTADGDVEIREDEPVTNADLRKLGMSRADLHRCFAEGIELMKGMKPDDRCRPVAHRRLDGQWEVHSEHGDPLMEGPAKAHG